MSRADGVPPVIGSGSGYYENMGADLYAQKINTPAQNPRYFEQFHLPSLDRVRARFGTPIRLLDIACGPAFELEFVQGDPSIIPIATDISPDILPSVKVKLGPNAAVFAGDVNHSALRDNCVEAGWLVNAMVYSPDMMLRTMHDALQPSGECVVNLRSSGNPFNDAFYDFYTERGGTLDQVTFAEAGGRILPGLPTTVLDYTECVDDEGNPDEAIRRLGQQVYFDSPESMGQLIVATGFDITDHQRFNFASPVNPDNQVDVFTLVK